MNLELPEEVSTEEWLNDKHDCSTCNMNYYRGGGKGSVKLTKRVCPRFNMETRRCTDYDNRPECCRKSPHHPQCFSSEVSGCQYAFERLI